MLPFVARVLIPNRRSERQPVYLTRKRYLCQECPSPAPKPHLWFRRLSRPDRSVQPADMYITCRRAPCQAQFPSCRQSPPLAAVLITEAWPSSGRGRAAMRSPRHDGPARQSGSGRHPPPIEGHRDGSDGDPAGHRREQFQASW